MKNIRGLLKIEDPVKRRAMFVALLSKEMVKKGGSPPVVVGGEAVEIYTQGGYTTGDIDIIAPLDALEPVLEQWGFEKTGRVWLNKELDIYIDWRGGSLGKGKEPETVVIEEDLDVRVISLEDLILDRLNAAKFWGDVDSLMWAKVLVNVKKAIGNIDEDYLTEKARQADISDVLKEALR